MHRKVRLLGSFWCTVCGLLRHDCVVACLPMATSLNSGPVRF